MLVGPVGPVLLAVPVMPAVARDGTSFSMQLMLVSLLTIPALLLKSPENFCRH